MGRLKKRLSKRKTLKMKFKIERKVAESNRQKRKESKGKPKQKRKDPGIPNSWPFKEEELRKIEEAREAMKLDKAKVREQRTKEREKARKEAAAVLSGGKLSASNVLNAQDRAREFNSRDGGVEDEAMGEIEGVSQRNHVRELKKMVEMSDVLLEVLDARDPIGSRSPALELAVSADPNKRLVIVLNKIDLIPRDALKQWLTHFRQSHPTIAFKASTSKGNKVRSVAVSGEAAGASLLLSSDAVGSGPLLHLLRNYSRSHGIQKSVVVGVFGYPNVGKSSLINSLSRSKSVGVSPCPGFTRKVTMVHLDKHIRLIDSPGVLFAAPTTGAGFASAVLRNAVPIEKVLDPIGIVDELIKRCDLDTLARHYRSAALSSSSDLLIHISGTRGKLGKGGSRDLEAAARTVLSDYNTGKIPYYTLPPAPEPQSDTNTKVVSQWAQEFDLAGLLAAEEGELEACPEGPSAMLMQTGEGGDEDWDTESGSDEDEDEEEDSEDSMDE